MTLGSWNVFFFEMADLQSPEDETNSTGMSSAARPGIPTASAELTTPAVDLDLGGGSDLQLEKKFNAP